MIYWDLGRRFGWFGIILDVMYCKLIVAIACGISSKIKQYQYNQLRWPHDLIIGEISASVDADPEDVTGSRTCTFDSRQRRRDSIWPYIFCPRIQCKSKKAHDAPETTEPLIPGDPS